MKLKNIFVIYDLDHSSGVTGPDILSAGGIAMSVVDLDRYIDIFRLSPSARYAFQGMSFLARQPKGKYTLVEDVAAGTGLPKDFLAKIFQKLSHQGLLSARRGPGGGYALARSADDISLFQIVESIEGVRSERKCMMEQRLCNPQQHCALHEESKEAREILMGALERVRLSKL